MRKISPGDVFYYGDAVRASEMDLIIAVKDDTLTVLETWRSGNIRICKVPLYYGVYDTRGETEETLSIDTITWRRL